MCPTHAASGNSEARTTFCVLNRHQNSDLWGHPAVHRWQEVPAGKHAQVDAVGRQLVTETGYQARNARQLLGGDSGRHQAAGLTAARSPWTGSMTMRMHVHERRHSARHLPVHLAAESRKLHCATQVRQRICLCWSARPHKWPQRKSEVKAEHHICAWVRALVCANHRGPQERTVMPRQCNHLLCMTSTHTQGLANKIQNSSREKQQGARVTRYSPLQAEHTAEAMTQGLGDNTWHCGLCRYSKSLPSSMLVRSRQPPSLGVGWVVLLWPSSRKYATRNNNKCTGPQN